MSRTLAQISFPKDSCTVPMSVTLRQMDDGNFATHLRDDSLGNPDQGYFWGHYFDDIVKAQMDYLDRAEEKVRLYESRGLKPIVRIGLT